VRSRGTKNTALKLHVVEDLSFLKNDAVPVGQLLMFWRNLLPWSSGSKQSKVTTWTPK